MNHAYNKGKTLDYFESKGVQKVALHERKYSLKKCFQLVGRFGTYDTLSVSVLLEVGKNACIYTPTGEFLLQKSQHFCVLLRARNIRIEP